MFAHLKPLAADSVTGRRRGLNTALAVLRQDHNKSASNATPPPQDEPQPSTGRSRNTLISRGAHLSR